MNCDLCNVKWDKKSPAWTYKTINTVRGPKDPSLPAGMGFWAEDDEWLVCVDCHALIVQGDQMGLLTRSITVQRDQSIIFGDTDGQVRSMMEVEIARTHRSFWVHRSIQPPIPEPGYRT